MRALSSDELLRARRIAQTIEKILASGDPDTIGGYIVLLVGPHPTRPAEPRVETAVLLEAFELYPGGFVGLIQGIRDLKDPRMTPVIGSLLERTGEEMLDDERLAQLAAIGFNVPTERSFPELGAEFLKELVSRLHALVAEMLSTAKGFYGRRAEELADDGHPTLAAMIATASDLFVPGTPLEAAASVLPFGRIAAVTKLLVVRGAQTIAASAAGRLGSAAIKAAGETAALEALARVAEPFASLSTRTVDEIAEFMARNSERVEDILQVVNRNLEKLVPQTVREFEQRLAARLGGAGGTSDDVLELLMSKPASGALGLDFVVLDDGRVIQRIRTSLYRRRGGRTSSAAQTARDAGLDADLAARDWGHIVPDVLEGADQPWNLVLMSRRYNRSVYHNIDALLERTPELEGLPVTVFAEFASIEAAQKRVGTRIVWELPGAGDVDPRFVLLGNPLNDPPATWATFMNELDKFFRRVKRMAA